MRISDWSSDVCSSDRPNCAAEGLFPAPKSREPRDGRWHFCLEHVRQYNSGWDFFRGMSAAEVLRYQREDVLGHRPTWRIGTQPQSEEPQVWVKDDRGIIADVGVIRGARPGERRVGTELVSPCSVRGSPQIQK